jgi:predicted O-methyltransferase YrrM
MISGHILGSFLRIFSLLHAPEKILEIGTYTGYSAICLARGMRPEGRLFTIEINDELRDISLEFFHKAGLKDRIELINGNALQVIPSLPNDFDLVFMDAFKEDYPEYYTLVRGKVKKGGYILADNTLWGGKVVDKEDTEPSTQSIREFNRIVTQDSGVENLLLPIRDGLMVIKIV